MSANRILLGPTCFAVVILVQMQRCASTRPCESCLALSHCCTLSRAYLGGQGWVTYMQVVAKQKKAYGKCWPLPMMLKQTAVERHSYCSVHLPCHELTSIQAICTMLLQCSGNTKGMQRLCFQARLLQTRSYPVALLQAYEARLNPFVEFQQHETESRVNKLNLHDRALLSGSR